TFLALLEMTRLRMTRLFQTDFESNIYIEFTAQVTEEQEQVGGTESADAEPEAIAEAAEIASEPSNHASGAEASDSDTMSNEASDPNGPDVRDEGSVVSPSSDSRNDPRNENT